MRDSVTERGTGPAQEYKLDVFRDPVNDLSFVVEVRRTEHRFAN
jgi:hypothetical protein